ncbi:hypothetical protein V491_05092 [Pseudogymnoascus sp. VKM F-3775]|nr:hypothetical protein V491_05092 [Pseudogymnoascus sp. VKM F-3775]
MRFTTFASVLLIVSAATADFHIVYDTLYAKYRAVPSNKYDCGNLQKSGSVTSGTVGGDTFKVTGNTCGADAIDFYKRADGHYDMYYPGGDGKVQGTCHDNSKGGGFDCGAYNGFVWEVQEKLICYSYLCK